MADQAMYHQGNQSVFVGGRLWTLLPPPALLLRLERERTEGRKREKFYIYLDVTHTHPFAHKHFYTQTLLHTDRNFYTQTLLHTDTLTQKPFDTQKLRHTDPIYTQTLLHTNAYTLTLTPFYIQHQLNRNFTSVFAHPASFRAKELLRHK